MVQKSTETLSERLDKAREENDDLRFQVRIFFGFPFISLLI